jgi:hypothetical protein
MSDAGRNGTMDLDVAPRFMLDKHARRLGVALQDCIAASDGSNGYISVPNNSPQQTALRTLHDLRLVERYSVGYRVTEIGRNVAASWRT